MNKVIVGSTAHQDGSFLPGWELPARNAPGWGLPARNAPGGSFPARNAPGWELPVRSAPGAHHDGSFLSGTCQDDQELQEASRRLPGS